MAVWTTELLGLASQLSCAVDEVAHRASISRSYYAGYHELVVWHKGLDLPGSCPAGVGVHESLIQQLKNPAHELTPEIKKRSRVFGLQLSAFKLKRRLADYEMGGEISQCEAEQLHAQVTLMVTKI